MKRLRIWLARKILGNHCPCYQMGCHTMVDFQQRSADALAKYKKKNNKAKMSLILDNDVI
jgi:hypothetical protein